MLRRNTAGHIQPNFIFFMKTVDTILQRADDVNLFRLKKRNKLVLNILFQAVCR